ncbi:hypothetical protein RclHR1_22790003 [Rhizophagus clarus]|uniref:Uncharacterized protein n=1 Tax=Rhizophagus clarus TaxID=94130 RepID=A0A2Z6QUU5_9GLOM|nr:hypothetical protein RclHR1_22790003 [Rhizophagus clarus]
MNVNETIITLSFRSIKLSCIHCITKPCTQSFGSIRNFLEIREGRSQQPTVATKCFQFSEPAEKDVHSRLSNCGHEVLPVLWIQENPEARTKQLHDIVVKKTRPRKVHLELFFTTFTDIND